MKFQGKKVLITGGSDGIGKAMAKAFHNEGADVWIIGRNKEKLHQVQDELMGNAEVRISSVDLLNPNDVDALIEEVKTAWENFDVLINNAGIGIFKPIDILTSTEIQTMLQLNVTTPFSLIQGLHKAINAGGSVINISSYLANRMMPHLPTSVYSATKGAINSMTKSLAMELGPKVRINAIAPGTVITEMSQKNISKLPEEQQANMRAYIQQHYPMKQAGKPNDLVGAALFLASNQASWITGVVLDVDGGFQVT